MRRYKIKSLILMATLLAGLWLAACKSTPTPGTPLPPQPEASQTKDRTQTSSSPPAGSAQPEKQETAETSQTSSSEASAAQTPEPTQKSQDLQTAATGAAETQSQQTPQQAPQRRKTAPQTAHDRLAKARDDLRVSQATEKRIAAELEELKKSGNASAEDIRNYETYLDRVQAMVAENRKMVEKMERAYAEHPQSQKTTGTSSELSDQQIPEEQVRDPVADLDRQLDASLTEFDTKLLKEMENIQTASNAKMRGLAQEAAEAAKRAKAKGGDAESQRETSRPGEDGGQESENKEKSGSEKSEDSAGKEAKGSDENREEDRQIESSDDSKNMAGKGKGGYGREDEDIVARQLREAAENETDPELKKKLWAEYEEYMKNTQ